MKLYRTPRNFRVQHSSWNSLQLIHCWCAGRLLQSGLTEEQEFYSPSSEESLGATIIIALIQDDSIAIEVLLLDTLTTARGPEETLNALSMLNEYVEDQGCEDGPLRESFRNLYRDLQEQGRAVIIPSALRAADTIDVSALAECLMNASRDVDEERM